MDSAVEGGAGRKDKIVATGPSQLIGIFDGLG
jgi:hypothetical protein